MLQEVSMHIQVQFAVSRVLDARLDDQLNV
jgi:hypothetical protein